MFKISVQTGGAEEYRGIDYAYKVIREAGFDAVDANIDHLWSYGDIVNGKLPAFLTASSDAEAVEYFAPWRDAAKKYGLENYQAHAPFPSYVSARDAGDNAAILKALKRVIMGCDSMDCRHLIIHPFFLQYNEKPSPEEEWATNIESYSALIPTAKQYGVTICLENMFTSFRGKILEACCSNFDTAARYIDTLNSIAGEKVFAFCMDTGHALLLGKDIKEVMLTMGDRIEAFHVHDNNGRDDQHLAPYMGVQDWDRFVEGLKAIKFNRTLSFETFNIWNTVDRELCPSMLRFIAETGRRFARRAEA